MRIEAFPEHIRSYIIPSPKGSLAYHCLGCEAVLPIDKLAYTCPNCGSVLLIENDSFEDLKAISGAQWRDIFDHRKMLNLPSLKGIFLFHELIAPIIPLSDIIYLGEGHTPVVAAARELEDAIGLPFYFKNDGQNPSASFKDRGMASAASYLNHLLASGQVESILAVCASTGDTSAAAALYASYIQGNISSAVLLPHGKVTPAQLSQPLGAGAKVIEIPGVFDDCMKVVEKLADDYPVALLNSKNAWRILGQQSYAFELAQTFDWDVSNLAVFVPVGNAGNITAVMSGFIKLFELDIITQLPRIIGVQSHHADPVFRYYSQSDPSKRVYQPVTVKPSVAQAAMIGNPVSMPRVIHLAERLKEISDRDLTVVQVNEQDIMDSMLTANRHGHVVCTQGGECLAGLKAAMTEGLLNSNERAVLDSTAHMLKFVDFQNMYFENSFEPEFGVTVKPELINKPKLVKPDGLACPAPGKPLCDENMDTFVEATAKKVASLLGLE